MLENSFECKKRYIFLMRYFGETFHGDSETHDNADFRATFPAFAAARAGTLV